MVDLAEKLSQDLDWYRLEDDYTSRASKGEPRSSIFLWEKYKMCQQCEKYVHL